jgi:hypothetical protein
MMTRRGFLLGSVAAGTLAAVGLPVIPDTSREPVRPIYHHSYEGEQSGRVIDSRFVGNRMRLTIQLDSGETIHEYYRIGRPQ